MAYFPKYEGRDLRSKSGNEVGDRKGRAVISIPNYRNTDKEPNRQEIDMPMEEISVDLREALPSPEEASKIVKKENKKIEEEATPKEKVETIAKMEGKTAEEVVKENNNEKEINSKFRNALEYLAPNAVGLLVGGLLGGKKGAVYGEQRGGNLGHGLLEYQRKNEQQRISSHNAETQRKYADAQLSRLSQKTDNRNLSILNGWTDSSGSPVFQDKQRGVTLDIEGNVLGKGQLRKEESKEKGLTPYQQYQVQRNMKKDAQTMEEKEYKSSLVGRVRDMGVEEKKDVANFQLAMTGYNKIAEMVRDIDNGLIDRTSFIGDSKYTAALNNFIEGFGRTQSGAAISKEEWKSFKQKVPTPLDFKKGVAKQKLKQMDAWLKTKANLTGFSMNELGKIANTDIYEEPGFTQKLKFSE